MRSKTPHLDAAAPALARLVSREGPEFVAAKTEDELSVLVRRAWSEVPGDPEAADRLVARLILARDRARPRGLEDLTREVFLALLPAHPRVTPYEIANEAEMVARGLQNKLDEIAGRVP